MPQIHLKLDLLCSLLLSINSPLISFIHPSLPLVFPFHLLELYTNSIQPNSIWSQYLERNHKVGYDMLSPGWDSSVQIEISPVSSHLNFWEPWRWQTVCVCQCSQGFQAFSFCSIILQNSEVFNKVHHSGSKEAIWLMGQRVQMDGFYLASLLVKACKSESKRLLH